MTCPMCLIKELGIFLKPPPYLHPNMPKSTIRLIQVGHPKISTCLPNQGIPNYYKTSLNLHHLSHPQVCRFSSWKQSAVEPPIHLTSLSKNSLQHLENARTGNQPYLSNDILHYNHVSSLLSCTSTCLRN
jgi:hypothetical protein